MITLRDIYENDGPTVEDVGFLYYLLNEREPGESISHVGMPSMRQHTAYVQRRPYAEWFIIEDGERVGSIYLTMQNEIGIHISKSQRGKGVGTAALKALMEQVELLPAVAGWRAEKFSANISPTNAGSVRFFERAGFKLKQNTYQLP